MRQEGEKDLLVHFATHPAIDPLAAPATHAPMHPSTQPPTLTPIHLPSPPPLHPAAQRPSIRRSTAHPSSYPFAHSELTQHPPRVSLSAGPRGTNAPTLCLSLGTDADTKTDACETHQGCRHPSWMKLNQQAQAQQGPMVPCSQPSFSPWGAGTKLCLPGEEPAPQRFPSHQGHLGIALRSWLISGAHRRPWEREL